MVCLVSYDVLDSPIHRGRKNLAKGVFYNNITYCPAVFHGCTTFGTIIKRDSYLGITRLIIEACVVQE